MHNAKKCTRLNQPAPLFVDRVVRTVERFNFEVFSLVRQHADAARASKSRDLDLNLLVRVVLNAELLSFLVPRKRDHGTGVALAVVTDYGFSFSAARYPHRIHPSKYDANCQ